MKKLLFTLLLAGTMWAQTPTTLVPTPTTPCTPKASFAAPNPFWDSTISDGQTLLAYLATQGYPNGTLGVNPLSVSAGQIIPGIIPFSEFAQYCVPTTTPILLVVILPNVSGPHAVGPVLWMLKFGFSLQLALQ